jgi:ABC-type antimicrobial peptide transport system permease subunit
VNSGRSRILELVLRDGIPALGLGLVIGISGALALSRVMESMLFGVGARDPGVFITVPVVLVVVAVLAMLVPALRATRVDPVKALSSE